METYTENVPQRPRCALDGVADSSCQWKQLRVYTVYRSFTAEITIHEGGGRGRARRVEHRCRRCRLSQMSEGRELSRLCVCGPLLVQEEAIHVTSRRTRVGGRMKFTSSLSSCRGRF